MANFFIDACLDDFSHLLSFRRSLGQGFQSGSERFNLWATQKRNHLLKVLQLAKERGRLKRAIPA